MCTGILTWTIWAMLFVVDGKIRLEYEMPRLATGVDIIGVCLYSLCIYTYYKIIVVGAGSPMDFPELMIERPYETTSNPYQDREEIPSSVLDNPPLDVMILHNFGRTGYRYCAKCAVWKPDRSHHCSAENRCVLRMDHHCPWFSVCIGFRNQKFFVQFLCYIASYSSFVLLVTTVLIYGFIKDEKYNTELISVHVIILWVLAIAFAFAVSLFAGFLVYLVLKNQTTIEFQESRWNHAADSKGGFTYQFDDGRKKELGNIYDLGYANNWMEVMGTKWYHWIFPIGITTDSVYDTYSNGINYRINEEAYENWCYNARLQDQLNQQLSDYKTRNKMNNSAVERTDEQ